MKEIYGVATFWDMGLAALSLTLLFLAPLISSDANALSSTKPPVGGACAYKQYRGEAQIASVQPSTAEPGTYEIKFSFQTKDVIREDFAKAEGKLWSMVESDFSLPREKFINTYDIKIGKRFPCIMNVITKGTCTPVLFDFPTIEKGRGA